MPAKTQHVSLNFAECKADFTVQPVSRKSAKYCSFQCGQEAKARISAAVNSARLRGGGEGKTYIKFNGRHMHRVVAEKKLGRCLAQGEAVHHIDGNKRNNLPENLEVTFQPNHIRQHLPEMLHRRRELHGY